MCYIKPRYKAFRNRDAFYAHFGYVGGPFFSQGIDIKRVQLFVSFVPVLDSVTKGEMTISGYFVLLRPSICAAQRGIEHGATTGDLGEEAGGTMAHGRRRAGR